jgi:FkbM family methyltransferase
VIETPTLKSLVQILATTSNWWSILLVQFGLQKETTAIFRNGMQIKFEKSRANGYYGFRNLFGAGARFLKSEDGLVLVGIPHEAKLWLRPIASDTLPAYDIFYNREYETGDLKQKTVIDIGAGNGDSAVYFATKGARRVYAYEPNAQSFEIAKRNITENHLDGTVILANLAVSDFDGHATLSWKPGKEGEPWAGRIIKKGPTQVTNITHILTETVDLLKIDCEGCETNIVKAIVREKLSHRIKSIALEYEENPTIMIQQLQEAGYRVKADIPRKGIIQAFQKSPS